MLKKLMVIVLLGFLGLIAGVAFGAFFPRYEVGETIVLPRHSPHPASELVAMTRGDHPGVAVVAHRSIISFSASGSLKDADRAMTLAIRKVIAANDGQVKRTVLGNPGRVPVDKDGLMGLAVGLAVGAAIAFSLLMLPKWRAPFATRARAQVTKLLSRTITRADRKPAHLHKPAQP